MDQLKEEINRIERALAGLNAEIVFAHEAHKELVRTRNEVHHILASHQTFKSQDIGAIRESISNKESEIDRLNLEITLAQIKLDIPLHSRDINGNKEEAQHCRSFITQLLRDRDEVNWALESLRASLSPIRHLPPEVLSEIFLCCQLQEDFIHPTPSAFPCLLGNVCSAWRSVALTTPRLWSSIAIILTGNIVSSVLSIVDLWITRSGSCPLSFKISSQQTNEDALSQQSATVITPLLRLFAPHFHRWKKVHLEHSGWDLFPLLSEIPDDALLPLLETIYLEGTRKPADVALIKKIMQHAPQLHSVSWISLRHHTEINIPWTQLTHIDLTGRILFVEDCLTILHESPSLRSCHAMVASLDIDLIQQPAFVHQNLQNLDIHALGHFGELLARLTLPGLKTFSLNTSYFETQLRPRTWPQTQFTSLITRSECSLETLQLSNVDISPHGLIECLRATSPSLQHLEVSATYAYSDFASVTDEVLHALTLSPLSDQALVPHLSYIKVWGCLSSSDGVLADMIYSRWMPCGVRGNKSKSLEMTLLMLKSAQHSRDISFLEKLDVTRISIVRV